jgi:hypothetical protein
MHRPLYCLYRQRADSAIMACSTALIDRITILASYMLKRCVKNIMQKQVFGNKGRNVRDPAAVFLRNHNEFGSVPRYVRTVRHLTLC